jgi:transposase
MMGYQSPFQPKLFYHHVSLEQRVPKNHILRKIQGTIDFEFIYREVKDTYGDNGNVSVPPPVILKMMLLLILYNVRSERELIATIPLRMDWLWFLGYDLDDEIPHHSVLSKARARWGVSAFKGFFERIVVQCVEAGLVDGSKLFLDTSLIDADASNNSVVDTQSLKRYLKRGYRELETRLDDLEVQKLTPTNSRFISTTDPDASVTRQGSGKSKLRYKTHRALDPHCELITVTKVTPGSQDDGELLKEMIDTHKHNTQKEVDTVVADSKYGTIDNYLICHDQGVKCHIPSLEETHRGSGRQKGIFPKQAFPYSSDTDTFSCPAGHTLNKRHYHKRRNHYEYKAPPELCANCQLRQECTRSKDGRTLKRHLRQDELDIMREHATSTEAKRDIKTRQHLSERSFGQSTRYGYKRARWRRLWRMQIQDFLIAATQNITVLITHSKEKISKSNALRGHIIGVQRVTREAFSFVSLLIRILSQFTIGLAWKKGFVTPHGNIIFNTSY